MSGSHFKKGSNNHPVDIPSPPYQPAISTPEEDPTHDVATPLQVSDQMTEAQVKANNLEIQLHDYFENNPRNPFQMMMAQMERWEESQAKFSRHIQSQMERSEQSQATHNQHVVNQMNSLHERMDNLEDDRRSRRSHSASSKQSKKEKPDERQNSSSPISPFLRGLENLQSYNIEQEPTTSQNVNISNDNDYLSFPEISRLVGTKPSPPETRPRPPEKTPAPTSTSEFKPRPKPSSQIPINPPSNLEELLNLSHTPTPKTRTGPDDRLRDEPHRPRDEPH